MRITFRNTVLSAALLIAAIHPAAAAEHIVKIVSDYDNMRMIFEPAQLTVQPGDTVKWVNQANESHNMITYPDGYPAGATGFASPYLDKAGQEFSHTFTKEGSYQYHCIPHIMMGMRGEIIVGKPSASKAAMHVPTSAESKAYREAILSFFDEDDFSHMPDYVRDRLKKK